MLSSVLVSGLWLGTEVQIRTGRQEFQTHATQGLPDLLLRLPKT